MKNLLSTFYNYYQSNKKTVYLFVVGYALSKFFYLNYLNWNSGTLLSGYGGIQFSSDSKRYLDGAENLIQGKGIHGFKNSYLGYMAIIALGKILGFGLKFTLVLQLLLNLIAGIALFDLIKSITKSIFAGIIGLSFYLSSPFIVAWVLFIHTESLFSSLLIISTWTIYHAIQKQKITHYLLSALIILLTASIRPNGWLLVPIGIVFLLHNSPIKKQIKALIYTISLSVFLIIIQKSPWFTNKGDIERLSQVLLDGEIICDKNTYHLSMPQESFSNQNDLLESCIYIAKHPFASAKLAILRVSSELLPIYRPWLSPEFKLRFLIWMLPAYLFTLISALFILQHKALKITFTVLLSQVLIIAATFSEREFRFLIPLLPLFYIAGSCGFYFVASILLNKKIKANKVDVR